MRIFGLTGYSQSGKDTVGNYLAEYHNFARISFAGPVKAALVAIDPIVSQDSGYRPIHLSEVLETMTLEEAKNLLPEVRRGLQRVGTEMGRDIFGENFWVDIAVGTIAFLRTEGLKDFVITDLRFDNEDKQVHALGGSVVLVSRPGVGPINEHSSDALAGISPDYRIDNDGSVEDLFKKIETMLEEL